MATANPSVHQYEPLRVPDKWGTEEKRFVLQVSDTLDDIYRRFGRLRFADLGETLQTRITSSEGILLEVSKDTIFRSASEATLIADLAALVPPIPMAIDLVWYDKTNKLFKRVTSLGPPIVWEVLQTNEVHTSSINMVGDLLEIITGGILRLIGTIIQMDASDAANSYINFGTAFNVSTDSAGNFALNINSPTDDAIQVNNKSVLHRGNVLIQQDQPAAGGNVIWLKPVTTEAVIYDYAIAGKSESTYAGGGYKEYTLSPQTADVMSAAGTYAFTLKFTLRHYGSGNMNVGSTTITLTKGAATLTLTYGAFTIAGWSSKLVTVSGTTASTVFTSDAGVINCKIQPSSTPAYSPSDFLAHVVGSMVECTITGPGGDGTAQLCEAYIVP